ncbi:TMEM175 family protein [Streptomyces sp. INA 01156]
MPTERMEAFSDGVIAILITVMVLELPTPHGTTWAALHDGLPVLLTYVLSFVYLGIYWNNHHHMLQATDRVNGVILWANLHLLFWLSLIPFTTAWMGQTTSPPSPRPRTASTCSPLPWPTTRCRRRSPGTRVQSPCSPPPWAGT